MFRLNRKNIISKSISMLTILVMLVSILPESSTVVAAGSVSANVGVEMVTDQLSFFYSSTNASDNRVTITYTITPESLSASDFGSIVPTLSSVSFQDKLPDGLVVINKPAAMIENSLNLDMSLPDIEYKLDASGNNYVADPITFQVEVEVTRTGQILFGKNSATSFHFRNTDGAMDHLYFSGILLAVNAQAPVATKELRVLEIQPQLGYEITMADLTAVFPDREIYLDQLPLTEFIGKVDEVNGKYDIVYMGSNGIYDDYEFRGRRSDWHPKEAEDVLAIQQAGDAASAAGATSQQINNAKKAADKKLRYVTMDVDITNRRADVLLKLIESDQLFIMDDEVLTRGGTKLKNNLSPISGKSNVHVITDVSNTALWDNISSWYDVSNKRPTLKLTSKPLEYSEYTSHTDKSSYMVDHKLSFVYNAYNENDNPMTTNLYLDINGDGIFTDNEKAATENVFKSLTGLMLTYNVDIDYDGGVAWKLELIEENGATVKPTSIQKGFIAFDGQKETINVLNLIPGDGSIDMEGSSFKADLTPSNGLYDIDITRMSVVDFDNSFMPGATPVKLNGEYDMIILGFGDSFGGVFPGDSSKKNRDILQVGALNAIKDFIATGQSVMFTHDTMGPQDDNNTEKNASGTLYNTAVNYNDAPSITKNFKDAAGFANIRTSAGKGNWAAWSTNQTYKQNDGLINMYPYKIDTTLKVATTHDQYWLLDLEDPEVVPWFNLDNSNDGNNDLRYYPEAYYYTFSHGTITFSGTGHSTPNKESEQELFVNTIFKAYRGANHNPRITTENIYDGMNVLPDATDIDFKLQVDDSDIGDDSFVAKFYIKLPSGAKALVATKTDLVKGELTDIILPKMKENPDASDRATNPLVPIEEADGVFEVIIEVEDAKGADASEDFDLTHKDIPTLVTESILKNGVLVGDKIGTIYEFSPAKVAHKDLITGISEDVTYDSTYFDVVAESGSGFTKSGDHYIVNPGLGEVTSPSLGINPGKSVVQKSLKVTAKAITPTSGVQVYEKVNYDYKFNVADVASTPVVANYARTVKVRQGEITVNLQNQLGVGSALGGITIEVYDSLGTLVADGTTDSTGTVAFSAGMVTDTYRIKVIPTARLSADGSDEAIVDLNFNNSTPNVVFIMADNTPPEIFTAYDKSILAKNGSVVTLPIFIKFDGMNSKVDDFEVKRVPAATSISAADEKNQTLLESIFSGLDASYEMPLDDRSSDDEDKINALGATAVKGNTPRLISGEEIIKTMDIHDNDRFILYTRNASGNETYVLLTISNIWETLLDIL